MIKNISTFIFSFLLFFIISYNSYAANIYVDKTLSSNITNGKYSAANRNDSGTDGNAYTTIQSAVNAMSPGDHIILRGGTYYGQVCLPPSKNGTSWNEGSYNKMTSYQDEWAILDGQNSCNQKCAGNGEPGGVLLGYAVWDHSSYSDLKYWWFERLELTGGSGRSDEPSAAAGFWGNGGPFKFRFLYVHDNVANAGGENPGGLKGDHWQDTLVEYCYFNNNGMSSGTDNNAAHILIYSDYYAEYWGQYGWNPNDQNHRGNIKNTIRYNYFIGSTVGYKDKASQFLTGRNPSGGHDFDDTYKDYGNKIHHNIFENGRLYAVFANQDFSQVYNNIISGFPQGITVQHEPQPAIYKASVYNNTIINPSCYAIIRYKYKWSAFESTVYWGYDYNNIVDSGDSCNDWCYGESITVAPNGSSGSCGTTTYDLTNYSNAYNYIYRPDNNNNFRLGSTSYTVSEFESQTRTHSPRKQYTNSYNGSDPLYQGTTGENKYKTKGSHVLEGSTTISNGGIGGNHPYLSGVTLPAYVGATNPADNSWVAGVLSLKNVTTLMNGGSDDPGWIEGGSGTTPTPPAIPTIISITIK